MKPNKTVTWLLNTKGSRYLLVFSLLLTVLSALGLKDMGLSSDYKIFFDKDDNDLQILQSMEDTYTTTDNVFIMITPPSMDVYTPSTLTLIHQMTERLWTVPHVTRVDSLTNFPYSQAIDDDIIIEQFVYEQAQITPSYSNEIKVAAQNERDLVGSLITQKGDQTAINVTTLIPGKAHKSEILAVTNGVNALLTEFRDSYPLHGFYTTGVVTMNGAFFKAAKRDFVTLIPAMILFVIITAGIILGSLQAALSIFLVLILSLLGALGLSGWLGINLSAPSVSAPIIMFTVIVASAIHIISSVKRQLMLGETQYNAVLNAYQHNAKPIIVSHITTFIGFVAMNASDSPPFRDLGNIVAFGIFFSLILSFTLLPFLLLKVKLSGSSHVGGIFSSMDKLANVVIKKQKLILYLFVPCSLAFAMLSFLNQPNDDLIKSFNKSVPFRAQAEVIDEHFSGLYNIGYSLSSGQENGIFNIEFLQFIEKFDGWLANQPEVVITDSPLHRIKQLNRLMNKDDADFYRLPDNEVMATQHFLLYEMSLPFGKEVNDQVSFDKSSLKLTARLQNSSSLQIMAFEDKVKAWLNSNKPDVITYQYSSPSLIFSHIGQNNIISLLEGAFIAFIVISIALSIIFRSVYIGFLTLIPNLIPVGAAFAFWYCVNGQISMGLASVSAMAIGIIVDDTVHFLYQYINGLKQGSTPEQSVRETLNKTMSAITISSMLLMVGFMLLSFSSFEKNAQMGLLTSGTIILALLFDVLVLPVIAMRFIRTVPHVSENSELPTPSNEQTI